MDYLLINELCRNVDAFRISTYLVKDRDQALKMGPVWSDAALVELVDGIFGELHGVGRLHGTMRRGTTGSAWMRWRRPMS